jgi:hypothetical protein
MSVVVHQTPRILRRIDMKSLRFALSFIVLFVATVALAQHEMQTSATQPQSDAQKSFTQLKSLAGTWRGPVTVDPPQPQIKNGELGQISLRVTSRGNALVHEMTDPTKQGGDPTKYDHPVTMLYLDNDRLTLVHYCDAGNRPRMVARTSPDGKTVEFDFVDVSGSTDYGNMYHAVFTSIDANHHIEDWTYMMPGNKPVHARMDLTRAQ